MSTWPAGQQGVVANPGDEHEDSRVQSRLLTGNTHFESFELW